MKKSSVLFLFLRVTICKQPFMLADTGLGAVPGHDCGMIAGNHHRESSE